MSREVLCGGKANADGIEVHTPTKKAPRHTSDNGAAPEGTPKVSDRARHVDRAPLLNDPAIKIDAVHELRSCLQRAADRLEDASKRHGELLHTGSNEDHRLASNSLIAARTNFRELNAAIWRSVSALLAEAGIPVYPEDEGGAS